MDAVEHVIDQAAQHAPFSGDERSYLREDGTLVIDILADPLCGTSDGREIVVCAPGQEHRLNAPEPMAHQRFRPVIQLGGSASLGLRAESGLDGADRAMVDLKIKF